ncbi:asparaginase [Acetobacteraceae bacterium]|nr:asparaginase [Candidatus Parcubacteria bacterium]
MPNKAGLTLITTGGTIDKRYGAGKGVRDLHIGASFAYPFLDELLEKSMVVRPISLMKKDSLNITKEDRARIVKACKEAHTDGIIITHGTDTMLETAAAISKAKIDKKKTIVLTGALQPAVMKLSDAEFNLGLAVGACLYANPGIYIAMNGVHQWRGCKKDPETGMFVVNYS